MTDQEYNLYECRIARQDWRRIEADPEGKEALEKFLVDEEGLDIMKTRLQWMIEGCYGRGQQIFAINEAINVRETKTQGLASLLILFAVFECRTKASSVGEVMRTFSPEWKARIWQAIIEAVDDIATDEERGYVLNAKIRTF